ncbi:hypothetical protein SKAU_G00274100 [Synaphobranchus kaupii]|uniref:CCHC-type domain-containing protein n=1 Tax=Synaphobranchus kaupii TaxID=118154 RepID=A0A9Q1F164_SYNKA|nr:hypothetical protein SKAU_G00274100 [Synaphobranchus kaupii]
MERALLREIGELERSIGELTRRKASRAGAVTSPEWQTPAVRVSRRPDGFRGRQDNPASVSHDGTPAKPTMQLKLPRSVTGVIPSAARASSSAGWLDAGADSGIPGTRPGGPSAGGDPAPAAGGATKPTGSDSSTRRFIQHRSAEASREKLLSRYRCEEESWGKVAADVQRYAREAYLEFDAATQEKLALHAFLRALTPERLRDHVSLAQPGSISEALIKTTQAEDTLAIWPTPQPTRQHVRVADGEEVRWTRRPLQRPAGRQGRCDEPGHIARDCPAPAPKPRNRKGLINAPEHPCNNTWSAVQESSQLTPAALMFGRELRTPVDLVFGARPEPEEPSRTREEYYHRLRDRLLIAHDFARKAQASAGFKQKRWYDTRCRGRAFAAGEQVWVYCPER